jgi:hypothetical protein
MNNSAIGIVEKWVSNDKYLVRIRSSVELELKNYLTLYFTYLSAIDRDLRSLLTTGLHEATKHLSQRPWQEFIREGTIVDTCMCAVSQLDLVGECTPNLLHACLRLNEAVPPTSDRYIIVLVAFLLSRLGFRKEPQHNLANIQPSHILGIANSLDKQLALSEYINAATRFGRERLPSTPERDSIVRAITHSAFLDNSVMLGCSMLRTAVYLDTSPSWFFEAARLYLDSVDDVGLRFEQLAAAVEQIGAPLALCLIHAMCAAWTLAELPPVSCKFIGGKSVETTV